MTREAGYLAVAGALAAAAYIVSTRNANAEESGVSSSGATNQGTGFAINNPGNVRYIAPPHNYDGQVGNSEGYGIYVSLEKGVRAMGKVLDALYAGGSVTIAAIISKYAPSSENPTAAYIASVSGTTSGNPFAMNLDPTSTLSWPGDKLDLTMAMIYQENGYNNLSASDVQTWQNS